MNSWVEGNKPFVTGWYWVTANEAGNIKMYDDPMFYDRDQNIWTIKGRGYYSDNIVAHMNCNKPRNPYTESQIGFSHQYYLKVTCNGITRYLSKGFQSPKWKKEGYSTKEKAIAAMKRLRRVEPEYGYQGQKTKIVVVDGNGVEIC